MARRVYIPGDKKKKDDPQNKQAEEPKKERKQTAAVRAAAIAMVRKTRKSIDPKILEAARSILPEKEEDINKMFFGDKDLLAEETIPIDRKKNVETVFEFLNSDKISESMKQKVAEAMKDTVL